jgi:uncharacterized protein YkwD
MSHRNKLLRMICSAAALILLLSVSYILTSERVAADGFYRWIASPQGQVGVSKPEITIWINADGMSLSSYSMYVNQVKVPVAYKSNSSGTEHHFSYLPSAPLNSGRYDVRFEFTFSGYKPEKQAWTFTVATDSLEEFPPLNEDQQKALTAINDYRMLLGLKPVSLDVRLNASALAHAKYQAWNGQLTHDEIAGKKGFTGETVLERTRFFGYSNQVVFENLSKQSSLSPVDAVDGLFDAPYHRIPFMHPELQHIGYGREGMYHVIHYGAGGNTLEGASASPRIVISPFPNEQGVPVAWDGNEHPDPVRNHPSVSYPVGYPIVVGLYKQGITQVTVQSAVLRDSLNETVPLLNSGGTGKIDEFLKSEIILIPQKALKPGEKYNLKLNLRVFYDYGGEETVSEELAFTTERVPGSGKKTLHESSIDLTNTVPELADTGMNSSVVVTFGLNDKYYYVNGIGYEMRVRPTVLNGTSYLYIRDLARALDASVTWDNVRKAAIYAKDGRTVILFTGTNSYTVNGLVYTSSAQAKLIGGNTMVPVRMLAEVLGSKVGYDAVSRTVIIRY